MSRRRAKGRDISGLLLLDKPEGITSNRALQEVKNIFFAKKAGHTGSLDPIATGILPICFGEATKFSQFLLNTDKKYLVTCKLGEKTNSADRQGEIIATADIPKLNEEHIQQELDKFLGKSEQIPPMHSAIKVNGQPLYKLAHKGQEIERKPRPIEVYSFDLIEILATDKLLLEVHCSKGTYVRTLIENLGDRLGCGAHVAELRRTGFGDFDISETVTIEAIKTLHAQNDKFTGLNALISPTADTLRDFDAIDLSSDEKFYVMQGQAIRADDRAETNLVKMFHQQEFIGVGEFLDDGRLSPKRLISLKA